MKHPIKLLVKTAFLSLLIVLSTTANAITNIEKQRIKNQEHGLQGAALANIKTNRGRSLKNHISAEGQIHYLMENSRWLNWISGEQGEVNDVTTDESRFIHSRYIMNTSNTWQPEIFGQWQKDSFAALNHRALAGAGFRIALTKQSHKTVQWSQGLGAFHEWLNEANEEQENTRLNLYNHLIYQPNGKDKFSLSSTIYYQPNIEDNEDYQAIWQWQFNQPISKRFSIIFSWKSEWDSRPPTGISKSNHASATRIKFSF